MINKGFLKVPDKGGIHFWLYLILRTGLSVIFIWAGFAKLMNPEAFAKIIADYNLVPENMLMPFAIGLPALELAAGIGLIFDLRWSLPLVSALLLLFIGVLSFCAANHLEVDCGCFSQSQSEGCFSETKTADELLLENPVSDDSFNDLLASDKPASSAFAEKNKPSEKISPEIKDNKNIWLALYRDIFLLASALYLFWRKRRYASFKNN